MAIHARGPLDVDLERLGSLIDDLRKANGDAYDQLDMLRSGHDHDYYDPAYMVERAYLKLLVATEALGLDSLTDLVRIEIADAKSSIKGFGEIGSDPEGEPYLVRMSRFYQFLAAIETLGGPNQQLSVTKDLVEILRATEYPLTGLRLFPTLPSSEDDVHRRIEGVLRCVFPDLKRKPVLSKQIKNFEPDTGLPSIGTLLEYKFIAREEQVPIIADQLLADTRGYESKDWSSFVYVLYETRHFRPENQWVDFLRECDVPRNTSVVVLTGEPHDTDSSHSARPSRRGNVRRDR